MSNVNGLELKTNHDTGKGGGGKIWNNSLDYLIALANIDDREVNHSGEQSWPG